MSSSVHTASSLRLRTNASELAASSDAPWAAAFPRPERNPDMAFTTTARRRMAIRANVKLT